MPGGIRDSSRTRVAPVFDLLQGRTDDWVRTLLRLPHGLREKPPDLSPLNLQYERGYWGQTEHGLDPPVSLLSWLIRNPTPQLRAQDRHPERSLLAIGDPATVIRGLHALRSSAAPKGWHLLEGPTFPDVLIETPDALIVIEGKRTELGATVDTSWLTGRHQIWRHIDAAWEMRGRRQVFGFFIVQGEEPGGLLPTHWHDAFGVAISSVALDTSFPHRSSTERDGIAACLLGGTTWQAVCAAFGIAPGSLPRTIHDLPNRG
jgi:hypothetical protein